MKKNWLIILIVFLLAANIALVGTLLVKNSRLSASNTYNHHGRFGDVFRPNPNEFEKHIAKKLELNEAQRVQLHEHSANFHDKKEKIKQNIGRIKIMYFENLSSQNTDSLMLTQLADSLGNLHATMIKLDYQHYKNLKSIFTEEQAYRFDSLGRHHMKQLKGEKCYNSDFRQGRRKNR